MKRIIHFIIFFSFITCFSSCFELIEEINMNQDGSGDMSITLNLSQSKEKVASILKMRTVNDRPVPSEAEIKSKISRLIQSIKQINGVSKVQAVTDFSNYIVVLSFSFADVSKINQVSAKIWNEYKIKATNAAVYTYDKASRTFARKYAYNTQTRTAYNKLSTADKRVFENAGYTSIYRFPAPIAASSNTATSISKSRKAVMQQTSVLSVIQGKTALSNTIKLQ